LRYGISFIHKIKIKEISGFISSMTKP